MSQPDLLTELRESRPIAPAEVREHVRQIAAQAKTPQRKRTFNWRRALVVAVPVAAAAAAAAIMLPGGTRQPSGPAPTLQLATSPPAALGHSLPGLAKTAAPGQVLAPGSGATNSSAGASGHSGARTAAVPATNPNRVQRVSAELELRVPNTQAVSDGTKRAVAIAHSLGGYPSRLDVSASGRSGYAELVLRIPKQNLQKAVTRLSALGTIMGENVSIQDIQAQVDATTHKLARLEARLAAWQAQPQTTETQQHIAALTDQIATLRRGRTTNVKNASYATVGVEMTTRQPAAPLQHGKSHFHGLAVAFRWAGIGAVYVLALGTPLALLLGLVWLAARTVRRRREDALLSRP
jgi:hypothetical protein